MSLILRQIADRISMIGYITAGDVVDFKKVIKFDKKSEMYVFKKDRFNNIGRAIFEAYFAQEMDKMLKLASANNFNIDNDDVNFIKRLVMSKVNY